MHAGLRLQYSFLRQDAIPYQPAYPPSLCKTIVSPLHILKYIVAKVSREANVHMLAYCSSSNQLGAVRYIRARNAVGRGGDRQEVMRGAFR